MEYKQGQFGRFETGFGRKRYGYYRNKDTGRGIQGCVYGDLCDICGDSIFYAKSFMPCEEPLSPDPSFDEWARFMFLLVPEIIKVETNHLGNAVLVFFEKHKIFGGNRFPREPNKSYGRADLFPPEPDWSQYIGHFGEFRGCKYMGKQVTYYGYLYGYDFNTPYPFKMRCGGDVASFASFSPGLPPEKLEESEAPND